MGKRKNNESGFSAVEALLILIIVILIGVVGYMVGQNHSTKVSGVSNSAKTSTSAKAQDSETTNLYAGWKQYCSAHERACFKYPNTWSLTDECSGSSGGEFDICSEMDSVTITSPSNSRVSFASEITGRGGDCAGAPNSSVTSVTPLSMADGLYLVQFSRADVDGINFGVDDKAPSTGDTGSCFMYTQFAAKNTPKADADFAGTVENSAKQADLTDALNIVKSFYYQ